MRKILFTDEEKELIKKLYEEDNIPPSKICLVIEKGGVCTIRKLLKEIGVATKNSGEYHRKYSLNQNYFDSIDTQDKAYFLGLLYADGCNNDKGRNTILISLQEEDVHILQEFKKFLQYDEKPLQFMEKNKDIIIYGERTKYIRKNQYRLFIDSKHMCKVLSEKGMNPRKTYTLKFPDFLSEDLYSHFIRGYFDGDGCLYTYSWKKPKASTIIFVSSLIFCNGLKEFLYSKFPEIKFCIYHKANEIAELRIHGIKSSIKILDFIYTNSYVSLNRKNESYNKLKEFFNNY